MTSSSESPPTETTEFLSVPAATGPGLEAGATLGAYVIRQLLGEGGMGRVYLAEQTRPMRREVALKLIREQVASPLARAYFDVERQALAQMRHPAIAQVFDAGTTEQGHPYLAMEVVEGRPITAFCEEERLDRRQRLALFARVCHGVQHAHQKGIIHRDLKPANVLVRRVDGEPMPKIIDFGIAIGGSAPGVDAPQDAAASDRAGTAVYMSPEQAQGGSRGLDTRSDVYSLGVMLYEVLTGTNAVALTSRAHRSTRAPQATLFAAIDEARDDDTGEPDVLALRRAAQRLPDELRAILLKALAPDRADRYDSAAALADDLERYRERRPVKAMPQTRWYLARAFVARHRLGLGAASLVAIALIAGITLALIGLRHARESAATARIEAAKAEQVADFVRSMLAGIDPDRAKSMDRSLMRTVLDTAADRADRELATQPAVRSAIERTIADSYSSLGELPLAGTHYDAALAAAREAGAPVGEIARIAIRAAENTDNLGKPSEAVEQGAKALAMVATLPEESRDRLFVESHQAGLESDAGQLETARTHYQRVLALQRRLFGDDDEDTQSSIEGLAIADSDSAHFDEARPLYETLIAHRHARYGDEHSKTMSARNGLAVLELEQGHFAAAEKILAPQLAIAERVFGPDHPRTLSTVSNLGGAIRQQGRNEEARPYYERALALAQKLYGPHSPTTVVAEANLAALLRDAGEYAQAERHARAATDNADAAFGDNPARATMFKELASVLTHEQRYADAERELDRAWQILSAPNGYAPGHPRSQEVVDAYIDLYKAWNKPDRLAVWRAKKATAAPAPAAP